MDACIYIGTYIHTDIYVYTHASYEKDDFSLRTLKEI